MQHRYNFRRFFVGVSLFRYLLNVYYSNVRICSTPSVIPVSEMCAAIFEFGQIHFCVRFIKCLTNTSHILLILRAVSLVLGYTGWEGDFGL